MAGLAPLTPLCGGSIPSCGSWNFNSSTKEGWAKQSSFQDCSNSGPTIVTNPFTGSPALSFHCSFVSAFAGGGSITDGFANMAVPICSTNAAINLDNKILSFKIWSKRDSDGASLAPGDGVVYVYLMGPSGSGGGPGETNFMGTSPTVVSTTNGIGAGSFNLFGVSLHVYGNGPDTSAGWSGTIYIDDASVQ
jgi:hypothetical protein